MTGAVDISSAIFLSNLLRTCRVCSLIVLIISSIDFILYHQSGWLPAFISSIVVYAIVQYPRRFPLLGGTCLVTLAAIAFDVWCFWRIVAHISGPDFRAGILLHFAAIAWVFYWIYDGLHRGDFKGRSAVSSSKFGVAPGFIETWLSGGWRSLLVSGALVPVLMMVVVPTDAEITAMAFLSLLLLTGAALVFFLIPAVRVVCDKLALSIIRAIAINRKQNVRQSYFFFVWKHILRSPKALGLLLSGTFFVFLVVLLGQLFFFYLDPSFASSNPASVSAGGALVFVWQRAYQRALMSAVKTIDPGSEPFTFFLRSFMDDETAFVLFGGIITWFRVKRFEELVAETVWPFGKLVALGRPGDELPRLGALRMPTEPANSWQSAVQNGISKARHVVIAVGVSSGVRWEFQQFENPENRLKLSLMILPEEGSVVATWRMFTAQYLDLLQSGENHIEKSLAVRFDRSGLPLFICSKKKSAQGYRIALNACLLPLDTFLQVIQSRGLDYRTAGV